jgi:uroporphyrin-III C-methyltransferase
VVTTLSGLADAAAGLSGPALLIVGEAMALAQAGGVDAVDAIVREVRA